MRDTEVLRRRLWTQIGLPLATATLLSACGSPSDQPQPVKQVGKADKPAKADAKQVDKASPGDDVDAPEPAEPGEMAEGYMPSARYEDIPEGEFDYFGPGRDPFGEHDEEEGCPAGDWCGTPDDARLFAVEHIPDQLGCPSKILAKPETTNSLKKDEKRWKDLSFHPMMQGRLMTSVTKEKREAGGDPTLCCYHWFEYCSGRPLLDGETMIVAPLRAGSSWSCDPAEVAAANDRPDDAIDPALRARLGDLWVEDARMEHASIAAFERATLELMAMAAPPELLGEVQIAAADEIMHAQRCFGLAARFSGQQREPGPLATLEPRVRGLVDAEPEQARADWVRLALDTFIEGCVGETIATLIARRGMRRCVDPATYATLERIVDDEGRHAGLAWRTIRWITETCGEHREAVLAALEQQAEAMAGEAHRSCTPDNLPPADPQVDELSRFGRCDRRTELLARRDAWAELILPTLLAIVRPNSGDSGPELWT